MPILTLDILDQQIESWQARIDVVAQNLTDLRALPIYQRLSGAPGFQKARLGGQTAGRVDGALDLMCQLFEHLDRLYLVLNSAKHVRRDLPSLFGGEDKMREIDRLLNYESIEMPPLTTPVSARNLLSIPVTERKIRPRDLLELMINAFEQAKAIVIEVDDAWRGLDSMVNRAELDIADFKSKLVPVPSELLAAEGRIRQIRKEIDEDPLGARSTYATAIEPLLVRLRNELAEAARVQREARQGLDRARGLFRKLVDTNNEAVLAAEEARTKLTGSALPVKDPVDQPTLDALERWINTLESHFNQGEPKPVLIGLDRWNARVAETQRTSDSALQVNRIPIAERRELRGRLQALQAKALAHGQAEQTELTELGSKAAKLLYDTPTPLDEARDLVRQYERLINGR
jgi:hypothetical protein